VGLLDVTVAYDSERRSAPDLRFFNLLTLLCFNFFDKVCFSRAESAMERLMVGSVSLDFILPMVFSMVVL